MWRELSPMEKESLKKARSPFFKAITFIEILILLFTIGFAISNFIALIIDRSYEAARGLSVDLALTGMVILLTPRLKKWLDSDLETGEMQVCEAYIDRMISENQEQVVLNARHREQGIAYYAEVHPEDSPLEKYKVKVDTETFYRHQAGDKVLLVSSKDEVKVEYMQLLEVK